MGLTPPPRWTMFKKASLLVWDSFLEWVKKWKNVSTQNVSREKYKKNVDCTSDCSTICTATAHCEAKSSSYNVTTCLWTDWIEAAQHSFTAHHDDDEDDHDDDDDNDEDEDDNDDDDN